MPLACFNPHPPLLAGETLLALELDQQIKVSIHTRHYWRVKRPANLTGESDRRFNPHPPLLAGETDLGELECHLYAVSIHTRHYWRVKQKSVP